MGLKDELGAINAERLGESLIPLFSLKTTQEITDEVASAQRIREAYPALHEALEPVKEHLRRNGFPENTLDGVLQPIVVGWWALARYAEAEAIEAQMDPPTET